MNPSEPAPVLEVDQLSVTFGSVRALDGVTYQLRAGEMVGLIGPNGAGKTTFIDAITGFVKSSGTVRLSGASISGLPPHRRARRGLTRTFQSMELFHDLTVRQNLLVAAENAGHHTGESVDELVARAMTSMRLADVADVLPGSLSLGRQKLVTVGRALAAGARVLLLDEPAAGLDSEESLEFAAHLRGALDNDTCVLLIDHDLDLVMGSCDRVFVLSFGSLISQGTPAEVTADPVVRAAYIGESEVSSAEGPAA